MMRIWIAGAAVLFSLAAASSAEAWKVQVRNDTDQDVYARVCTETLAMLLPCSEGRRIAPRETAAWETAQCPCALDGEVNTSEGRKKMNPLSAGTRREINNAGDCNPDCGDSSWRVCRKRGFEDAKDYDFGFCPD